jgi:hypothetical protein
MFAQVIQGRAKDKDALRAQFEKWERELKPGAKGLLGSTAGVANDGTFVAVVRFESSDAARANSDRPEQGRWWDETSRYLEGDVVFHNCGEVETWLAGGSDDAGFVQIMQGRVNDVAAARRLNAQAESIPNERPDVIGGTVAWHDDPKGEYTEVVYFTSEEEARAGEKKMNHSQGMDEFMQEWEKIHEGDVRYIDLSSPWFSSP